MNLLNLISQRSSVRDFASTPIEREKIEYLIESARLAPSAVNAQPWYFIVIQNEENKLKIQSCYQRDWFKTAPVYILVCGDHTKSWKRKDGKDFCNIDIAIAVEHICLMATEQGFGTCWVCNFDAEKCKELFELPSHIEPIVILPVGYPKNISMDESKMRKNLQEIIRWEKF